MRSWIQNQAAVMDRAKSFQAIGSQHALLPQQPVSCFAALSYDIRQLDKEIFVKSLVT